MIAIAFGFALLVLLAAAAEFDRRFSYRYPAFDYYLREFPRFLLGIYNTILYLVSDRRPILPLEYFPRHDLLARNYRKIRDEVIALSRRAELPRFHDVDPLQSRISDDRWRVLVLKWYDRPIPANARLCPFTAELIASIPEIHAAMFSILEPRKTIPEHKGPYKGCLRYHLALKVPQSGDCYIEVDGRRYQWKEGEGVLFDDTYRHRVANDTEETRIVLFCDVERPLPFPLDRINRFLNRKLAPLTDFVSRINRKGEVVLPSEKEAA
jgi:aspartyl/asparaginyl beta-hydroxylase (cupin superfamily)